jgi:hypothetical protein
MKGFKDAAVTTTLCMVMKERQYSRTQSEFEIENYIDESLKKYFYENARREHYAIDNPNTGKRGIEFIQGRTFVFCDRDMSHGSKFPSGKKSVPYKWNVERSITWSEIVDKYNQTRARETGKIELHFHGITFNTQAEFDNFNSFMYSEEGSRFMSIVTKALNCDGFIHPSRWMPKLEWSRPWTLKQLLLDYGYSYNEIIKISGDKDCTSEDEFEIENYIDPQLKKYFYENTRLERIQKYPTLKNCHDSEISLTKFKEVDADRLFLLHNRALDKNHKPAYITNTAYKWNVEKSVDKEYMMQKHTHSGRTISFSSILFNTKQEKDNFAKFFYDNPEFIHKLIHAIQIDSYTQFYKVFPNTDWTKPQTVESILLDYNYTPAEIAEIFDDLKNYRYMDEVK